MLDVIHDNLRFSGDEKERFYREIEWFKRLIKFNSDMALFRYYKTSYITSQLNYKKIKAPSLSFRDRDAICHKRKCLIITTDHNFFIEIGKNHRMLKLGKKITYEHISVDDVTIDQILEK